MRMKNRLYIRIFIEFPLLIPLSYVYSSNLLNIPSVENKYSIIQLNLLVNIMD